MYLVLFRSLGGNISQKNGLQMNQFQEMFQKDFKLIGFWCLPQEQMFEGSCEWDHVDQIMDL